MPTKYCRCCGKEFTPKSNASQYCSKQCQRQHYNITRNEINATQKRITKCAWCGETFTATGRFKYCSLVCGLMAKGKINGIAKSQREKPKNTKPHKSIEEVAKICGELQISYGEYMTRYGGDE